MMNRERAKKVVRKWKEGVGYFNLCGPSETEPMLEDTITAALDEKEAEANAAHCRADYWETRWANEKAKQNDK